MVITISPQKIIIAFFKMLLGIVILAFASSLVLTPIVFADENQEPGVRRVTILKKTYDGYSRNFKVEDVKTGNKFSITPTEAWYNSMENGDETNTFASLNDTRVVLTAWLTISFVIDLIILAFLFIWFLMNIPDMIGNLEGKEFTLDLRSKKVKRRELTLRELEKTPEFKAWRKDYEAALVSIK